MFGRDVERALGGKRWFALYFASVVSGALVQLLVSLAHAGDAYPTLGASAGVFGVLVAYALFFPQRRVMLLFPPVPMPAWLFATMYGILEFMLGVSGNEPGIAHFAHLGGMLGAGASLGPQRTRASDRLTGATKLCADRTFKRSGVADAPVHRPHSGRFAQPGAFAQQGG